MKTANNILVTRAIGSIEMKRAGHAVIARHNSMTVTDEMADGRPFHIWVEMLPDVWDAEAINRLGRRGAFREVPNVAGIQSAITAMQEAWGQIPVQDNSGLVGGNFS